MDDLSAAALRYMTDKAPYRGELGVYHHYTLRYHELFAPIRADVRKVLEIGVQHGASLKMWRDYFTAAEIHGVEIDPIHLGGCVGEPRITVHIGDIKTHAVIDHMVTLSPWDIIVDDASHDPADMRDTCIALLPHARSFYVIEDIHVPWFGAMLSAALWPLFGEPEVLPSQTTPDGERVAWIWNKMA